MGREIGDVSVVTPTIRVRRTLLRIAAASVEQQHVGAKNHWVVTDRSGDGPAVLRNQMIHNSNTEWIAFLDDDDMLYPHHLSTLLAAAQDDGGIGKFPDVVIPFCDFIGEPLPQGYYNRPYDRRAMRKHGIFPITVLARRSAMLDAGLFDPADRYEDWSLWNRMADNGCRFVTVPEITWTYRRGHPSRTGGFQ